MSGPGNLLAGWRALSACVASCLAVWVLAVIDACGWTAHQIMEGAWRWVGTRLNVLCCASDGVVTSRSALVALHSFLLAAWGCVPATQHQAAVSRASIQACRDSIAVVCLAAWQGVHKGC